MEYKVETSLWNFPAWSGGKDTLDVLKERDDVEAVESYLEDIFMDDDVTDGQINDYLWFERDDIAEHLGFKDWEAYEEGWSMEDLDDADEWFCEADFDTMERISGYRRDDYSEEDGYQDFVDAVEEWWNGLDDRKKVEIYCKEEGICWLK